MKNTLLEKKHIQNLLDICRLIFLFYNRNMDILLHVLIEFEVKTTFLK